MHSLPIGILCAVVSATRIWTVSSLDNVYPDSVPPPGGEPHVRIYAAKGEYESFQICVRSSHRTIENLDIAPEYLSRNIGPPEVRRVDYLAVPSASPRAYGEETDRPDPLSAVAPFTVEKEKTSALWVTYYVPPDCPAGLHEGRVGIYLGDRTKRYVSVTLEVFDFEIPATPNLTAAMWLSADSIRSFHGIVGDTLEEWRPFYDALASWRLAYDAVLPFPESPEGMALYLEHLRYSASSAHMPAICMGMGETLANRIATETQANAFRILDGALTEQGWARRAYAEPMPPLPRSHWAELQSRYAGFREITPSVRRLLRGVPHPDIQELAEIWVLPLQFFDPIAIPRLRAGMSLSAQPAYPLDEAQASSSAPIPTQDMPHASTAADAYDGSLYTAWTSGDVPTEDTPQWLEIRLREPVATKTLRLGWRAGHEAHDPLVELSRDATQWSPAKLTWKHHPSDRRFDQSWSEGVFDRERQFTAIRLSFSTPSASGPVSVTELELGRSPDPETIAYLSGGAQVWFEPTASRFPSFHADAHPVEARLAPWVCWGHGLDGLFGQPLNQWPETWKQLDAATPRTWPAAGTGERLLVYPAQGTLAPSIRLYRLRDGLEDFEYVRKAMETGVDDRMLTSSSMSACRWEHYAETIAPRKLDSVREELLELRTAIGRGIAKAAREN